MINNFSWNYSKCLLIGASGSGKTTLFMKKYLTTTNRKLIIDTNLEVSISCGLPYTRKLSEWSFEKPCYYPKEYTVNHLDSVIRYARRFNNFLFFIDDVDSFSGGEYYNGKELNTLMINGRHQNIGVFVANKRIVNIPRLLVQNSRYIHLWNVDVKDYKTLEQWNFDLNYPSEKLRDLTRLSTHTFALFKPQDEANPNATNPKIFDDFYEL